MTYSTTARRARLLALCCLPVLVLGLLSACTGQSGQAAATSTAINPTATSSSSPAAAAQKPNIIMILTDDLDAQSYTLFPNIKSQLTDQGVTFSNFYVPDSLCCPSRSSLLRGQYVHNHQVLGNTAPDGGYQKFHSQGLEHSTVGTWLQAAGYRTALMGKYLNGYPDGVDPSFVPPGWNEWDSPSGGNPYSEYNYKLNENGKVVAYGSQPQDYMIDVISRKATDFINGGGNQPFFMYLATYAPHQPATPAPRHADAFPGATAPRTPSFNEADMSDKPAWLRDRPLLSDQQISQIDQLYRKRLQSMLAVDDLVASLVQTLQKHGQLDNTYIVFTSDNGFHLGQHRLPPGKQTAYDEDIRVPLVVRGPGVPAGQTQAAFALNLDLAPTYAQLAGATLPDFVDGRSLLPLLQNPSAAPADWRQEALIEHYRTADTSTNADGTPTDPDNDNAWLQVQATGTPGPSATPGTTPKAKRKQNGANATPSPMGTPQPQGGRQRNTRAAAAGKVSPPTYSALRNADYLYVEYTTGDKELYDIRKDPNELQNLAGSSDPQVQTTMRQLSARLQQLRNCHGASCRPGAGQTAVGAAWLPFTLR